MGKTVQIAHQHRAGERSAERFPGAQANNRQGDSKGYRAVSARFAGDGSDCYRHGATGQTKGGAYACRIAYPTPQQIGPPYLAEAPCPEAGKKPLLDNLERFFRDSIIGHQANCRFADPKGIL